jgi:serine/threonine protein phosphatase PrpC
MSFLPANAQHIGARSSQQDSFGFGDPDDAGFLAHGGFVAVVCDGMGGMEHGDLASRTAVRSFLEAYGRKNERESIPAALERSVREANDRVVAMAHELGAAESVGTTLVAAVLRDAGGAKEMYFISVGDSGLFYVSGGQIQTVNRPHVFANILDSAVARGAMSKEQALLHPERESLTSFIGVDVLEEIDRNVDPWPVSDGDSILLASDGLFKTLTAEEILGSLNGHPQRWPDALVMRTLERKYEYQDNVTVLSVTVRDKPDTLKFPPPAVEVEKPEKTLLMPPKKKGSRRLAALALAIGITGAAIAGGGWLYKKHHAAHVAEKK